MLAIFETIQKNWRLCCSKHGRLVILYHGGESVWGREYKEMPLIERRATTLKPQTRNTISGSIAGHGFIRTRLIRTAWEYYSNIVSI